MMTSDEVNAAINGEISAAIKRLEGLDGTYVISDVFHAFSGGTTAANHRDALVSLLRQADPDTHIELPKDADGVPLHVGDDVYARCEYATQGHYYYFNGNVHSIEIGKDGTFAYVTTDCGGGDQFRTCELHHGSHIPTSCQIVEDLVDEAFNLGADKERAKERHCNVAWEARKELVERFTKRLKPLLSDDAE